MDVGTGDSPRASTEDRDNVDASTGDGLGALTSDEDGLASVGGGEGCNIGRPNWDRHRRRRWGK